MPRRGSPIPLPCPAVWLSARASARMSTSCGAMPPWHGTRAPCRRDGPVSCSRSVQATGFRIYVSYSSARSSHCCAAPSVFTRVLGECVRSMESLKAFPWRQAITFSNIALCVTFFIFTEGSMNDPGSRLLLSAVYIRMYFGRSRVFAPGVSGQARKSRWIHWLVRVSHSGLAPSAANSVPQ